MYWKWGISINMTVYRKNQICQPTHFYIENMKYVGWIVRISSRGAGSLDRKKSTPCLQQHGRQQRSSSNSLSLSRLDPPPRIISIEGKMEEHNNILEQVNIRKISVQDKINMEEHNNILDKLNRPSSWNRCVLKNASEHLKRDRKTVMAVMAKP